MIRLIRKALASGLSLALMLLLAHATQALAVTPAGTLIKNQAYAIYIDDSGQWLQSSSNEVETRIRPAPGVRLEVSQSHLVFAGRPFVLPHSLTNTGNIMTRYRLSARYNSGRSDPVRLYQDKSHNGQLEGQQELTEDLSLAPGETAFFLVAGTGRDDDSLTVRAEVQGSDRCTVETAERYRCFDENQDTLKVSTYPGYNLTQRMDQWQADRDEEVTVTLSYQILGDWQAGSSLQIIYPLSDALEYVTGSRRWLGQNGGQWDDLLAERHSIGRLQFTLPVDSADKAQGTVSFRVRVQSGFAGTTVNSTAGYRFTQEGGSFSEFFSTNTVPLRINASGVAFNGSPYFPQPTRGEAVASETGSAMASAGTIVRFIDYLWNTGSRPATYRVSLINDTSNSFPPGSRYYLATGADRPDDSTDWLATAELTVANLAPQTAEPVYLYVQLPERVTAAAGPYRVWLKAVQSDNPAVSDQVENRLEGVIGAFQAVDLSYSLALTPGQTVPGQGPGPQPQPLATQAGEPGQLLVYDGIYINNTGDGPDSYTIELDPQGGLADFSWQFIDDNQVPLVNTGIVRAKTAKRLRLQLRIPKTAQPLGQNFTVRVRSAENSTVTDQLRLALQVQAGQGLSLAPPGAGQVVPGNVIVFAHRLENRSNRPIDGIRLQLEDSLKARGWRSTLYIDRARNGQLDSYDKQAPELLSLPEGASIGLLVKVFAPANALALVQNITRLSATWGEGNALSVTDSITVNSTNVLISKAQAPWDCTGPLPNTFSKNRVRAQPGQCIVYRLTAINQGAVPAKNIEIHDVVPGFTELLETESLPWAGDGRITTSRQAISARWAQDLAPGQSVSLRFAIKIR